MPVLPQNTPSVSNTTNTSDVFITPVFPSTSSDSFKIGYEADTIDVAVESKPILNVDPIFSIQSDSGSRLEYGLNKLIYLTALLIINSPALVLYSVLFGTASVAFIVAGLIGMGTASIVSWKALVHTVSIMSDGQVQLYNPSIQKTIVSAFTYIDAAISVYSPKFYGIVHSGHARQTVKWIYKFRDGTTTDDLQKAPEGSALESITREITDTSGSINVTFERYNNGLRVKVTGTTATNIANTEDSVSAPPATIEKEVFIPKELGGVSDEELRQIVGDVKGALGSLANEESSSVSER